MMSYLRAWQKVQMTRAIKDPTGRFNNLPPEVQQAWRRVLQTIDYLSKEK